MLGAIVIADVVTGEAAVVTRAAAGDMATIEATGVEAAGVVLAEAAVAEVMAASKEGFEIVAAVVMRGCGRDGGH